MIKRSLLIFMLVLSVVAEAKCKSVMLIGVNTNAAPYSYEYGKHLVGIDIEIAKLLLNHFDICYEFIPMPNMARAKKFLELGKLNALLGVPYSDQQHRSAFYSVQYRHNTIKLFVNNPYLLDKLTLIDMLEAQHVILFELGMYLGPEVEYLKANPPYQEFFRGVSTIEQRLMMLSRHHAQVSIENELVGKFFIRHKSLKDIYIHDYLVHKDPAFIIFSRKAPFLNPKQRQELDELIYKSSEKVDEIILKYN